jgi:hypothetical protein
VAQNKAQRTPQRLTNPKQKQKERPNPWLEEKSRREEKRREKKRSEGMSILWEKSGTWRWLVKRTKESKPFFIGFATICGVVPGVIGYGVMQFTNTRNPELEARLRQNARPDSLVLFSSLHFLFYFYFLLCLIVICGIIIVCYQLYLFVS